MWRYYQEKYAIYGVKTINNMPYLAYRINLDLDFSRWTNDFVNYVSCCVQMPYTI